MKINNESYNKILNKLRSVRKKETLFLLSNGILKSTFFALLFILFASFIELLANGDEVFRGILLLITILSVITLSAYNLTPTILRWLGIKHKPSIEKIALRVGEIYPDLKDDLCNSIQLVSNLENPRGTSQTLALAAFDTVYQNTENKNFNAIIDKSSFKKWMMILFFTLIFCFTIFGVFSNSIGASLNRLINWNESFLPPAPFSLSIEPVNVNLLRNDLVTIKVKATGQAPQKITLFIREQQQENFDSFILTLDTNNIYNYSIQALKNSIVFYAEAMWLNRPVRTEEGQINIIDKPLVRNLNGRINYPAYTKLAPKSFDDKTADITALKGSVVDFSLLSNKELSNAEIVFIKIKETQTNLDSNKINNDTVKFKMIVNGKKATGNLKIQKSGIYYFNIWDKNKLGSDDPVKFNIVALNDEYPSINLLEPSTDVQLTEEALLPIKIVISDDYGFSNLKLFYRLADSRYTTPNDKFSSLNIPITSNENSSEIPFLWNLNKIGISPEDRYEYYLEVYDNDIVSGPKLAKTSVMSLRLPSLEEVLKSASQEQKRIEKELEKVMKKAEEIKKDMEELNKELLKNPNQNDLSWKEKKKAEEILKKQAEITEKLAELQSDLNKVAEQLQENNAISPETLQKYMELQKLMQEVKSPELKMMQEKMQQALDKLSQEEMQKALKNMQFNEEQFRKSIERTMNILKRLKAEQKVDALTKRAEELQKKQSELEKKMDNTNPSDKDKREELSNEQKALQEDLKDLLEELRDLESLMKEIGEDMPMDELNKAKNELNQNETSQEMQNSANSCNSGDFNKAKNSQQKVSKNLKNFAEQMKKLKEKMQEKVTKEVIKKMQKSINDVLELSKKQEQLNSQTKSTDYNSTQFNNLAQQQNQLYEGLANVANGMMELAQKSFAITPEMGQQIGNALQEMQKSIQNLSNRQTSGAAKNQENAMSSMNQAASSMQNMLSMMQQQSSGSCPNPGGMGEGQSGNQQGSYGERLQQLAMQQQAINQSLQQQIGQSQGRFSPEQQAEYGRISDEQGNAKKSLEELSNEQKSNPMGQKKTLGDLDKIVKEMQETISDINSNNITPETMKRQERILSRLLDASKSLNERDFETTREARSGKDVIRKSPSALDLRTQEGKTRAFQDYLRSIQQGYTKDYEMLIRQYFELIQKSEN